MPRPIKKHLINTRRRKHHGGGKKKVSKKGRTTKRKVWGRVKKLLTSKKQGGSDERGPSKDSGPEPSAKAVVLPWPRRRSSLNYNIKIEEIIDNGKTAAKKAKEEAKTAAENDKAPGIVNGNKIDDIYQKYLVPIKNYRDNDKKGRFKKFAVLFWDFIKLEIINIKKKEKKKTLRKFVEDCLFKWHWCNLASLLDHHNELKDWKNFHLLHVLHVLNGDEVRDDSENWKSDFGEEALANIEEEKKKIDFDDDAENFIEDRTWVNYSNRRKKFRRVRGTDDIKTYEGHPYFKHDVYSGNPDNRFSLNTINFNNKACAEYRLWIIFKACFEEYGKAEERSSGFFLRKKTILEKLFKEAEANAEKKREREESKEGASL